eukprot:1614942-Amphidinium_carterae.2
MAMGPHYPLLFVFRSDSQSVPPRLNQVTEIPAGEHPPDPEAVTDWQARRFADFVQSGRLCGKVTFSSPLPQALTVDTVLAEPRLPFSIQKENR